MKQKTFHIITIGCAMNKSDSERIAGLMKSLGFAETQTRSLADFVFINTCGVRQSAEDRIFGFIPDIRKNNKKVKIIITGCLSKRKDVIRRIKDKVDLILPIQEISKLTIYLANLKTRFLETDYKLQKNNYLKIKPDYDSKFIAYVPIGNGCDNFCSYCVVPFARGREVYRSVAEIIKEAKNLIKDGYKEINLIAQNVNSYKSGNKDFADLLLAVNNLKGDFWIRFATNHPKDMSDKLIKTIAQGQKICKHIHLPVQAGDNKILQAMNRKYTVAHYEKLINKIRKNIPDVAISTDVIVGFSGETKAQFNNSKSLFKKIKFDLAYLAQYSPRPGTAAFLLEDNVDKTEKKRREEELNIILSKTALENNKKYVGKKIAVLVEGVNKNNIYYGKTDTYKVVKINSLNKKLAIGTFINVKITKANSFGMDGEVK